MKLKSRFILTSTTALMLLSGANAIAQEDVVITLTTAPRNISNAQIRASKPVVNPLKAPDTSGIMADTVDLPYPKGVMKALVPEYGYFERAYGSFGIPYTTTRVQDGDYSATGATYANFLSTTYPYRSIGKLTYDKGTGPVGTYWACSASLIRKSVIVTAAHCVQTFGSNANTFTNFQFTPGHYGAAGATATQIAPYGTWKGTSLVLPTTWTNGTDIGCEGARDNDLAVIVLAKNAANKFAGDVVGYMAYGWNNYSFVTSPKTGNFPTAAVSTLGYPLLLDNGAIMQRTDGPAYTTTICNAGQLWQGSSFTDGSSGGPWIVNFASRNAVLTGGAVPGTAPTMAVIGVTSWGSDDPNPIKDNYASQFRQNTRYPNASYGNYGGGNIGSLLNTLCSGAAPGGGTYASRGYCN